MRNYLSLRIPHTNDSESWLKELNLEERGLQIQNEIIERAGVFVAGHGEQTNSQRHVTEVHINFVYRDFDFAISEMSRIADRLQFPKGANLQHFKPNLDSGTFEITELQTW